MIPKSTIFVFSEREISGFPFVKAFEDLGYDVEPLHPETVSAALSRPAHAIVIPSSEVEEQAIGDTLARIRQACNAPIILADSTLSADSAPVSIGIYSRLPGEKKTLEEILEEVDRRMYADKRERNEDRANDYRT